MTTTAIDIDLLTPLAAYLRLHEGALPAIKRYARHVFLHEPVNGKILKIYTHAPGPGFSYIEEEEVGVSGPASTKTFPGDTVFPFLVP